VLNLLKDIVVDSAFISINTHKC